MAGGGSAEREAMELLRAGFRDILPLLGCGVRAAAYAGEALNGLARWVLHGNMSGKRVLQDRAAKYPLARGATGACAQFFHQLACPCVQACMFDIPAVRCVVEQWHEGVK